MSKIVCAVCGSSDVQAKVWTKPNENFETTTDFLDEMIREPADCWCCNCEENLKLMIADDDNDNQSVDTTETEESNALDSILEDSDKCEGFAEMVLDEIRSDEEQLRHIGSNIIKAYQNGDCDELLIAICGWSMDSLLDKYQKSQSEFLICPACQEVALRYAMIDIDGTNLEEGYCCGECGEEFLGVDNEEVKQANK